MNQEQGVKICHFQLSLILYILTIMELYIINCMRDINIY